MTTQGESTLSNFYTPIHYTGVLRGDSGGALLAPETNRICGIASRIFTATTGFPFFIPEVGSDTAAIDSPANRQFLEDIIYDKKHERLS